MAKIFGKPFSTSKHSSRKWHSSLSVKSHWPRQMILLCPTSVSQVKLNSAMCFKDGKPNSLVNNRTTTNTLWEKVVWRNSFGACYSATQQTNTFTKYILPGKWIILGFIQSISNANLASWLYQVGSVVYCSWVAPPVIQTLTWSLCWCYFLAIADHANNIKQSFTKLPWKPRASQCILPPLNLSASVLTSWSLVFSTERS